MPTDKIYERSLSSKNPVDVNSIFMKLYYWRTILFLIRLKVSSGETLVTMPVKYFAPKVTGTMYNVSLIFPPRDNRDKNNEQSEGFLHQQLFIPTVPV